MVELDQFKVTLNSYRGPLQEVRDKLINGVLCLCILINVCCDRVRSRFIYDN